MEFKIKLEKLFFYFLKCFFLFFSCFFDIHKKLTPKKKKKQTEKKKLKSITKLYLIAFILSFEIPQSVNNGVYATDIFPYAPAYSRICQQKYGDKVELFIRSIVITYYIRIIHNILNMNKAGSLKKLKPVLTDCNTLHQQIIMNSFSGPLKEFLDITVWKMITSTSSKLW